MDVSIGLALILYRFHVILLARLSLSRPSLLRWIFGLSDRSNTPNTLERLIIKVLDGWARTARRWLAMAFAVSMRSKALA